MTVKEKILPLPLTCTHSSWSLAQSPQTGRGQKTHVPQFLHFCIMSLPALAPSQKGWLTGVISGSGFRISVSSAIAKNPFLCRVRVSCSWGGKPSHEHALHGISENGRSGAAEILAIIYGSDAGRNTKLDIRHLPFAAFTADLTHGFEHVQHAARRRRLAAVDHAPARLDRQIAFEGEVGLFEERFVVSTTES